MAITIIEQPQSHTPIYNDMVVLLSSNLTSNPKFLFGLDVDLILENSIAPIVVPLGRLKSPAVFDQSQVGYPKRGFFNVKELLKYITLINTKGNTLFSDISHLIRLTPGEEYAASASGVATYYPSSANIEYVGFNGALRLDEFRQFVPTDLINTTTIAASSGIGQYILSSYTQPKDILKSTLNELTFLCNGGTNTRAVFSYYINNALISTQTITQTTTNRTDLTVNGSYNALAVPTNANKIGIRLERISNGQWLTNQYEYNLVEACSKYPTLNVYFQNKWGAYDSFIFNKKSTKNDSINRKTYQKQDRYINTYNSYDPAIRTYDSEIKTKHTLRTDWITEDQLNWLSELVESNNVQFSYDSDYGGGSPASFEMQVTKKLNNKWGFDFSQQLTASMAGITLTFNGSPTMDFDFAEDFYDEYLFQELSFSSNFATYFNFSATYTSTYISVLFTAKQNGVGFNLSSLNTYASDQITALNNTSGVNNTANLIPVTIDDTSFEFKTKDNDKLFQLTINATETSVYNRQNL